MEQRREGRTLPACRNIRFAEIIGDRRVQSVGEIGRVADLPGSPPTRLVQDGLAVEADEIGRRPPSARTASTWTRSAAVDREQMRVVRGQSGGAIQNAAEIGAQAGVVGQRQRRAEGGRPRSPSVSSQAASTPSSDVPLISPIVRSISSRPCRVIASGAVLHATDRSAHDDAERIPARSACARLRIPVHRSSGAGRGASAGTGHRLYRLRLHRRQPACRQPGADHDAAAAAAARPQAGRADGRRHHAKVGDPSGKESAPAADRRADRRQHGRHPPRIAPFLRFGDGPSDAIMANNADWLDKLGYIPLLRDVGPHFTINRMLAFDSVKPRLDREQPLTFLEFNYSILQGYDFRELHRAMACRLQMGGSDQWGNIVSGIDLGRRTDGRAALRPDHAADHHRVGRQDGQDARRARCG